MTGLPIFSKKPAKKKEISRVNVGIHVFGGTVAPHAACQLYRIEWSDGTSTIERGRSVTSLPGALPVGAKLPPDVRPDLQPHMQAAQILLERIGEACWDLDQPKPTPKKRRRKTK